MRTLALILGAWLAVGGMCSAQEATNPISQPGAEPMRLVIRELEFPTHDLFPWFSSGRLDATIVHEHMRVDSGNWVSEQPTRAPRDKMSYSYRIDREAREIAHAELLVVPGTPAISHSRELNPSTHWELPASLYWQDVAWQARADAQPQANGRFLLNLTFERTGRESRFRVTPDSFLIPEQQTLRVLSQLEIAPGDTYYVHQEAAEGLLRAVAVTVEGAPTPDVKSGPPSVAVPEVISQINFEEPQPVVPAGGDELISEELISEPIRPQFAPELPRVTDSEPSAVAEDRFQLSVTEVVIDQEKLKQLGMDFRQLFGTQAAEQAELKIESKFADTEILMPFLRALSQSDLATIVTEPKFEVPDGRPGELRVETMVPHPQQGVDGQFILGETPVGLRINCTVSALDDHSVRVKLEYRHSQATPLMAEFQGQQVPGIKISAINTHAEFRLGQTWLAACLPYREEGKSRLRVIAVTPRRLSQASVVETASHVPGLYAVPNPPELHFESAQPDSAPGVVWLGPVEPLHLPAVEMLDAEPIPLPPVRLVSESEEGSVHISGFDPELDAVPVAVRFRAPLPSLAVNLNEEKMNRYLRVSIVLHTDATPQQQAVLTHALALQELEIRDALVSLLSDKTVEQVRGRAGIDTLREEVRGTINRVLGTEGAPEISRVLFVDFAVQ